MKFPVRRLFAGLLLAPVFPAFGAPPVEPLDQKYGVPSQPAYVKHYEADKTGKVMINPYLQVASPEFPAILDAKSAPFNWVIDEDGRVGIIIEAKHPMGRVYDKGFVRPEDQSTRKPGTTENFGHVSALAGAPGRISGEILYDKGTKTYIINNKSGRYSKHNADRTPEQFVEAVKLIRAVVDPGELAWGPAAYLIEYAPAQFKDKYLADPRLAYDDPKAKKRPHLIVMEGGPGQVKAEAPSVAVVAAPAAAAPKAAAPKAAAKGEAPAAAKPAKTTKVQAAHNDDPS